MLDLDRRTILASGGSLALTLALGGCEGCREKIANRPTRRNVATMAANDPILEAYRDGIAAMQALGGADPRNWMRQAEIHQNHCPHGNWFFLAWHRAYILSFERIIRELSGYADFALPYWDWRCQRSIPATFWGTNTILSPQFSNPSYPFTRLATQTSQADITVVGPSVIEGHLQETDFELFASGASSTLGGSAFKGPLEAGAHDYIHASFVRGTMRTFMSPLDPIFWLHHNILDYLWFEWNNRGNANTNDPDYVNMSLDNMFVDQAGNPVSYNVGALILAPLLSYQFEPPAGCGRAFVGSVDKAVLEAFLRKGAAIRFKPKREFGVVARALRLDVARGARTRIALPAEAMVAQAEGGGDRLLLRLDRVAAPPDASFYVRVFVDLPDGSPPVPDSPHYAGAFAFFGGGHGKDAKARQGGDHAGHGGDSHGAYNYLVDISRTLDKLRASGRMAKGPPVVTLVSVPNEGEPPGIAVGPVEIAGITPILIDRRAVPQPLK
jgi:tyrosinase